MHGGHGTIHCQSLVSNFWRESFSYELGGVYSPDVTVLRRSESNGYAFLAAPEKISVVSVAGDNVSDNFY